MVGGVGMVRSVERGIAAQAKPLSPYARNVLVQMTQSSLLEAALNPGLADRLKVLGLVEADADAPGSNRIRLTEAGRQMAQRHIASERGTSGR